MKQLNSLAQLFLLSPNNISLEEDFESLEASYSGTKMLEVSWEDLNLALKFVRKLDSCYLSIKVGGSETVGFYLGDNYQQFVDSIRVKSKAIDEQQQIILKIKISKKQLNNKISLYSIDLISEYLNVFNTEELIGLFSNKISSFGGIFLINEELKEPLYSNGICICASKHLNQVSLNKTDRIKRLEHIRSSSHCNLISQYDTIPEDYILSAKDLSHPIVSIFNRVSIMLLLGSIYDGIDVKTNYFSYKLNGYRVYSGKVNFSEFSVNRKMLTTYHCIYDWIYQSGSIVDKIGLSRNVISLYFKEPDTISSDENIYQSILSGYKVYEKQNIMQYVEVRNKMTDQLIDYGKNANLIVDTFASGFQKSALAVVTFFTSVLALRILGSSSNSYRVVLYSSILSSCFVFISFLYMIFARKEVHEQKNRFTSNYKDFKRRYTDLLTIDDITVILNNDSQHNNDINFINKKICWYTKLWGVILLMIMVVTVIYYFYECTTILKETIIYLV